MQELGAGSTLELGVDASNDRLGRQVVPLESAVAGEEHIVAATACSSEQTHGHVLEADEPRSEVSLDRAVAAVAEAQHNDLAVLLEHAQARLVRVQAGHAARQADARAPLEHARTTATSSMLVAARHVPHAHRLVRGAEYAPRVAHEFVHVLACDQLAERVELVVEEQELVTLVNERRACC